PLSVMQRHAYVSAVAVGGAANREHTGVVERAHPGGDIVFAAERQPLHVLLHDLDPPVEALDRGRFVEAEPDRGVERAAAVALREVEQRADANGIRLRDRVGGHWPRPLRVDSRTLR